MIATDTEPPDGVPEAIAADLEGSDDARHRAIIVYAHRLLWEQPPVTDELEARVGEEIVRIEDHGAYTSVAVESTGAADPDHPRYAYRVQWEPGIEGDDGQHRWHYLGRIGETGGG